MSNNEEAEDATSLGNEWEAPKTVDNEEGEEATPRGNEWEVVSLTASAYAAAPGPRGDESIHEEDSSTVIENDEAETSRALFMSRHFIFPPSQHENLPIEPEKEEILKGDKEGEGLAQMNVQKEDNSEQKEDENWKLEGFNVPEEFPGMIDVKSNVGLSFHGSCFDEATGLHVLNVDDKEQDIYGTAKFSSFHSGADIGGSAVYDENTIVSDLVEPSDHGTDSSSMISQSPESGKDEYDDSELPCGAWWKRRVASLCAQAKETNTFWSIFVAAAVMGLVLLGQRWQQERWQVLQQRWQLSISDEKSGRILSRLKDVIVGGNRRGTYIAAASVER